MLGEVLKAIRVANNGMSTKLAAERAQVSSTYINLIENGSKNPSYTTLKKLATAYNIPLSQIFLFDENQEENNLTYQQLLILILKYYVTQNEMVDETKKVK